MTPPTISSIKARLGSITGPLISIPINSSGFVVFQIVDAENTVLAQTRPYNTRIEGAGEKIQNAQAFLSSAPDDIATLVAMVEALRSLLVDSLPYLQTHLSLLEQSPEDEQIDQTPRLLHLSSLIEDTLRVLAEISSPPSPNPPLNNPS